MAQAPWRRTGHRSLQFDWIQARPSSRPGRPGLTTLILTVAAVSWAVGLSRLVSGHLPLVWAGPTRALSRLPAPSHRASMPPVPPGADRLMMPVAPASGPAGGGGLGPALEVRRAASQTVPQAAPALSGEPEWVAAGPTLVPHSGYADAQARLPAGLPLTGPFVKWGQISRRLSLFCGFRHPRYPGHTGVDLLVDPGADVLSTLAGRVVWAAENGAYGNLVVVENGGWQVWLAHLSEIGVRAGEAVTHGQTIGASGGRPGAPGAGSTGGPHLHYGIRDYREPAHPHGVWVDPTVVMPMEQVTDTGCSR